MHGLGVAMLLGRYTEPLERLFVVLHHTIALEVLKWVGGYMVGGWVGGWVGIWWVVMNGCRWSVVGGGWWMVMGDAWVAGNER